VNAFSIGPFDEIKRGKTRRREIGVHHRVGAKVNPRQNEDQHQNQRKKCLRFRRVRPNGIDRSNQFSKLRFLNS
jgi:hypothetical protein